jgi:cation:H+ antiporter
LPLADAQDYPLWLNVLVFLVAAIAVWNAGTRLTRDLDRIAGIARLNEAFVGMLLLGGITSLPEIANVATSATMGNPRLGINNLLGSAAINVLLLAVADAWIGRDAVTSVVAKPSTLMMATLCMLVLIAVGAATTTGDAAVPGLGVGIGAIVLCAMSLAFFWLAAGYDERAPWTLKDEGEEPEAEEDDAAPTGSLSPLIARAAIAAAVIFVAGYVLSQIGDGLAEQTGIGSGMMGFVLIGVATSMPELSSIVTALRIRRYEMAFGQVLGTNFFNLSLILLADAFFAAGPVIDELGPFEVIAALLGAMLTGIFMVGLLERRNPTIMRMGYDSLAVMILFAGGLGLLWAVG